MQCYDSMKSKCFTTISTDLATFSNSGSNEAYLCLNPFNIKIH